MRLISSILLFLLVGLPLSDGAAAESGATAIRLAERDGIPAGVVEYENDYAPRVNFGAALEPDDLILHGAGQDPQSYREYSALFPAGNRPLMLMTYITVTGGPEKVLQWRNEVQEALSSLQGQETQLQIGLNLTTGNDDGSGAARVVATGAYDEAINAFVDSLGEFGVPSFVRIGYEFEGSWNGYTPEGFVSAFKYITDRIRERGLDDIATVWCAAGGSAGFIAFEQLMQYYPGDEYVDWWGVDVFSPEEIGTPWLGEFYDLAAQRRKPVMLGEVTPRFVGADKGWESWTRWFKPFFEMVRAHPEIKAISYINWDWVYWSDELGFGWHDWEDARLQRDEVVQALYVEELSHPIWKHASGGAESGLFARDSLRIDSVVCPFKGTIEYQPGDIDCGLLEVPENREDPDSRFIELHFVKLNSRWGRDDGKQEERDEDGLPPGKRDDPIIYLTGGPGARVNYYVKRLKDHSVLDHRDVYILEQRGIGYSDDFCPFYSSRKPEASDVETFAENLEVFLDTRADCINNARAAGVDVTAYNTIENARDVKALRMALGYEQWNVWGISYGSILGQAYIKEDPDGILAVALDAIMPLDIQESELYWRIAHWYDRDLKKLQEICDRQPDCARHYPDLGGRLRAAVRSVVDNPIVVEAHDTEVFPSGQARVFQDIAAYLPFILFYEQDNYPGLPGLIYAWAEAVETRDMDLFEGLVAGISSGDFIGSSDGMRDAIFCLDGDAGAQARAGKVDIREYPVLGAAIGSVESYDRSVSLCNELGLPKRPAAEYRAVSTYIPSLIIEGDMDPITPPPNAKAILPGFENGTYVEFPFAGHGPSRSVECAGPMLNRFYDDPEKEPDLSCLDEMEEPDIWAPLYVTRFAPRMMAVMGEDKKKLAAPAAWAVSSFLVLLVSFLYLSFAALVRRLDGRKAVDSAGTRVLAWLTALVSMAAIGVFGGAFAATAEASEMTPLLGLISWARYGAWLGLAAGVLGWITLAAAVRAHRAWPLPVGSLAGFVLTGIAAISLSAFLLAWDLGPF